jgi:subtilisin-like proprotein convertase family protein
VLCAVLLSGCGGSDSPSYTAGIAVSATTLQTAEGGANVTFSVALTSPISASVTVDVALTGDEGYLDTTGTTWRTLTFTPTNWSVPQVIQLLPRNDTLADGDQTYPITVGISFTTDTAYAAVADRTITVTNLDDEAGLAATPASGLLVTEAGGTDTFTVVLQVAPTAQVDVPITVSDATEVQVSPATLTFTTANWMTPQTVTVTGVDDADVDGAVSWTVTLGPPTSTDTRYSALPARTVSGTTTDDDAVNQGSAITPIDITALRPYAGQVASGSSYYVITGLAAGNANVVLTGVSGDVSLAVYSGADFASGPLCTSAVVGVTASESCTFAVPVSGTIYVRVDAAAGTTGALFTVDSNVTFTWVSTDVPQSIADLSTVLSTVAVTGGPSSIAKVTVQITSIVHTWDSDLDIYIRSPAGTEVELSTDNGPGGDNYTNTVFDDAAATSITLGTAPFTGTFRPEGLLSTFNGQNANGTWTLRVYDDAGGDVGSLQGWSVTIN